MAGRSEKRGRRGLSPLLAACAAAVLAAGLLWLGVWSRTARPPARTEAPLILLDREESS